MPNSLQPTCFKLPLFKSYLLVLVQFATIGFILMTGPWWAQGLFLQGLEIFGLILGVWAAAAMRPGNFHVMPEVKQNGRFVGNGPYRWIRHPMYLAILLVTGALVATDFTPVRLLVWFGLLVDILIKLHYEEQLLSVHYPEYTAYRRQTKRLAPFLY